MVEARNKLLSILSRTKASYLARRCYVTKNAVYNWTAGRNGPGPKARSALSLSYGIDSTDWNDYINK